MEKFNCVLPTWDEIYSTAKNTVDKIKNSDFYPDTIIAIARGGLIPGRLFADFLHVKDVIVLKADHWGITASKDGKARISYGINKDLIDKKVLLVDDITDTGDSIELAKRHIDVFGPKEIKTATLYHLTISKYIPDFFGHMREWAWVIFPWNYREDMVNIIKKIMKGKNKSLEELRKELKKNYNIDQNNEEINEVLEHIKYLDKVNNG